MSGYYFEESEVMFFALMSVYDFRQVNCAAFGSGQFTLEPSDVFID